MTYQITISGPEGIETFDLSALPKINGLAPLQAAAEGRLAPHQLYGLLKDRGVPGISTSDGCQALCIQWARHIKKMHAEIQVKNETDVNKHFNKPTPPVLGAVLTGNK